jgi:hypothetical protein
MYLYLSTRRRICSRVVAIARTAPIKAGRKPQMSSPVTGTRRSHAATLNAGSTRSDRAEAPTGEFTQPGPIPEKDPEGRWVWLLALPMLACCGGPALIALVASVGAVVGGLAVGLPVALVLGVVAVVAVRRRRAACCAPGRPARRS